MSTATPAYDGMTEEEIAAMEELQAQIDGASEDDPEFNPEATVKAGEVFGGDRNNQVEEEEEEEVDPAAQQQEQKPQEQQEEPQPEQKPNEEQQQEQQQEPAKAQPKPREPIFVAQAPEDAEAKLADIGTKKGELAEKFDDGEITSKEYQTELDKLNREERAIERQVDRAQLAAEMEEQRAINEREEAINTFLASVDIPRDLKSLRFQALDAAVRIVANDEANAELSYAETMQKAYELCVAEGTLQAKKAPAQEQKQEPKPAKQPKKPIEAPPSLARMPAAETTDTEENRFAWLNSIRDPDKREREFAKMSAADQDAYLAAGG